MQHTHKLISVLLVAMLLIIAVKPAVPPLSGCSFTSNPLAIAACHNEICLAEAKGSSTRGLEEEVLNKSASPLFVDVVLLLMSVTAFEYLLSVSRGRRNNFTLSKEKFIQKLNEYIHNSDGKKHMILSML